MLGGRHDSQGPLNVDPFTRLIDGQPRVEPTPASARGGHRTVGDRRVGGQVGKANPRALEPRHIHIGNIVGQCFQRPSSMR